MFSLIEQVQTDLT